MPIRSKTKSKFGHWTYPFADEAGATRTITQDDFGKIITNSGGALTATLPTASPAFRGAWVKFYQVAAGDLVIDCATADTIIADNDAAADSVTFGLDTFEIGTGVTMVCNGSKWLTRCHFSDETTTVALAT